MNFPAVVTPRSVALFMLLLLTVIQCAINCRGWRHGILGVEEGGHIVRAGEPLYYPSMIFHTIVCLLLIRGLVWIGFSDTFPPGSAAGEGEIPKPAN